MNWKSTSIWSDHNLHDPGITLLEHLAYAISDLSYRLGFSMEDLLAESGASKEAKAFFSATDILPQAPQTLLDYRKLLLDCSIIENGQEILPIKNAWLQPLERPEPGMVFLNDELYFPSDPTQATKYFNGLYQVLIEPKPGSPSAVSKIWESLHQNRNLGEDVKEIVMLNPKYIGIQVEIEVDEKVDLPNLHLQIIQTLRQWVSPDIRFYSLAEMLAKGFTPEEIFQGPLLAHGFIDDEELERFDNTTSLRTSDALHLLMDLPGVRLVRSISLKASQDDDNGIWANEDGWEKQYLSWVERRALRLAYLNIKCYRRNQLLGFPPISSTEINSSIPNTETWGASDDLKPPAGKYRNPGRFFSITQDLPQNYGVGANGLPASASATRLAQAKQLKGYLAIFEQLHANYLTQLAHAGKLLGMKYDGNPTYFAQTLGGPDGIRGYNELWKGSSQEIETKPEDQMAGWLDGDEASKKRLDRHDRRLGHLLARFGENYPEPFLIPEIGQETTDVSDVEMHLGAKLAFLSDYPVLGYGRAKGINYLSRDPDIISGLEKRLRKILGIGAAFVPELAGLEVQYYDETDQVPDHKNEFRFRMIDKSTKEILLSASTRYADLESAQTELKIAIKLATNGESYKKFITRDGRFYFNIVDATGEVLARRIKYFSTVDLCDLAIQQLKARCIAAISEELYVVENHLLRPREARLDEPIKTVWIPKCNKPDPWSLQLSFVYPKESGRFISESFVDYVRGIVESETPVHLKPRLVGLVATDMEVFQSTFRDWRNEAATQKKEAFGDTLASLLGICDKKGGGMQGIHVFGATTFFTVKWVTDPLPQPPDRYMHTIGFWLKLEGLVPGQTVPILSINDRNEFPVIDQHWLQFGARHQGNQVVFYFKCMQYANPDLNLEVLLSLEEASQWNHWSFVLSKSLAPSGPNPGGGKKVNEFVKVYLNANDMGLPEFKKENTIIENLPSITISESGPQWEIGNTSDQPCSCFLTDFRFYNEFRDKPHIQQDYQRRLDYMPGQPGQFFLHGYWRLDDRKLGAFGTDLPETNAPAYRPYWEPSKAENEGWEWY